VCAEGRWREGERERVCKEERRRRKRVCKEGGWREKERQRECEKGGGGGGSGG